MNQLRWTEVWRWGWPAFAWMGLIFLLSHQDASESQRLSGWVISLLENLGLSRSWLLEMNAHLLLRKLAHFTEYFVLGILVYRWFSRQNLSPSVWLSILWCLLFAISDEWHQSFVPGRGSSPWDVLVDLGGAGMAIVLASKWLATSPPIMRKSKRNFS